MDKQGIIYAIQNKVDHRVYVGHSTNLITRRSNHFSRLVRNKHPNERLQKSFNEHGKENFEFFIIDECSSEFLLSSENYWCNLLNSHDERFGYNIQPTNPNGKYTSSAESTKIKIGNAKRGTITPEHVKEKIRIRMKSPDILARIAKGVQKRVGIKQTQEHIDKRLKYHIGAKRSESAKKNMRDKSRSKKYVCQFNLDGEFIGIHDSQTIAGELYGVSVHAISRCASGKSKTSAGFIWKRLESLDPLDQALYLKRAIKEL